MGPVIIFKGGGGGGGNTHFGAFCQNHEAMPESAKISLMLGRGEDSCTLLFLEIANYFIPFSG